MVSDEYAAGFFDGEGSVSACVRNKRPSPTIIVSITNTQRAPLDALKEKWGGSIAMHKSKSDRQQDKYQWVLASKQAKPFLEAIRPHLLIKMEQVDVAIAFRTLMETPHKDRVDYSRTTFKNGRLWVAASVRPEFREECWRLHGRIREINSRNVPVNARRRYELSASYPVSRDSA